MGTLLNTVDTIQRLICLLPSQLHNPWNPPELQYSSVHEYRGYHSAVTLKGTNAFLMVQGFLWVGAFYCSRVPVSKKDKETNSLREIKLFTILLLTCRTLRTDHLSHHLTGGQYYCFFLRPFCSKCFIIILFFVATATLHIIIWFRLTTYPGIIINRYGKSQKFLVWIY